MTFDDSTASLARKLSVSDLIEAYRAACADIVRAFKMLDDSEKRLRDTFAMAGCSAWFRVCVGHKGHRSVEWSDPSQTIDALRREAWGVIVERLELRRVLSTTAWEKLEKTLRDEELPEISEANVEAFAAAQTASIADHWQEAVREVFDFLRPHHYDHKYKTNDVDRIGQRVVLSHWISPSWDGAPQVHYQREQAASALERVFAGLDGQGHVAREHYSELHRVMRETRAWSGTTTYYDWRAFKNGSLHLRFKRADLVEKLNLIAGGARLKKAKAA